MKSNWNYPTTIWVGKNRVKDLSCSIISSTLLIILLLYIFITLNQVSIKHNLRERLVSKIANI